MVALRWKHPLSLLKYSSIGRSSRMAGEVEAVRLLSSRDRVVVASTIAVTDHPPAIAL
jgi:hypothetical protein